MNSVRSNNLSLKYQRFTPYGWTQFLPWLHQYNLKYFLKIYLNSQYLQILWINRPGQRFSHPVFFTWVTVPTNSEDFKYEKLFKRNIKNFMWNWWHTENQTGTFDIFFFFDMTLTCLNYSNVTQIPKKKFGVAAHSHTMNPGNHVGHSFT